MLFSFVSYNKLTSLPIEIGNLSSLVSLMVQHNQLNVLVEDIGKLDKLEELVIKIFVVNDYATYLKKIIEVSIS